MSQHNCCPLTLKSTKEAKVTDIHEGNTLICEYSASNEVEQISSDSYCPLSVTTCILIHLSQPAQSNMATPIIACLCGHISMINTRDSINTSVATTTSRVG